MGLSSHIRTHVYSWSYFIFKQMNLWGNYKKALHDTFDLEFAYPWANWESKGTVLLSLLTRTVGP